MYERDARQTNDYITMREEIAIEFTLNEKQRITYGMIAKRFVQCHVHKSWSSDSDGPLRMMMTGSGGTGKSHAVRAAQRLMERCRVGYLIRFLGPTGTSARNIDGATVHKGLSMKIREKKGSSGAPVLDFRV